ncbi:MAG TPA: OmpA family protein [Steroidobacteraceae bacterium]|nr:OmpA family protein [Steroidobacteraceae bacterium]
MNNPGSPLRSIIAVAVAAALFAGCASAPTRPAGSAQVRAKLTALQSDPTLASAAPVAMKDAETAVTVAEMTEKDLALAAHRVYLADRKVDTARALAQTQAAESERKTLTEAGEKARLDARTREADLAKSDALVARAENAEQKLIAGQARENADAAQLAANASQQQAAELQRQLEILQARPTDRGLVLTLGDTLFATGKAELKSGATVNLDKLTAFMNEYPTRTAAIEGYTDSMGSDEMNQSLSQRRADAVKGYLVGQGVSSTRLSASGRGENSPVADNESAAGRQQNRRVEVVISPLAAEGTN